MQAYKDKLHAALREIAECPVSMRTVEQAAACLLYTSDAADE